MLARTFRPGLAGLYIPDEEQYGPFRGIGVRIEDDVLFTSAECEVLSHEVGEQCVCGRGRARRGEGAGHQ